MVNIKTLCVLLFCSISFSSKAQFAGPVGSSSTTAMYKDSSAFKSWANSCIVTRGYQDVANTSLGFTDVGVDTNGINMAGYNPVVSLGDGGSAILSFNVPISDGVGFDFAVFENAFSDQFLELAFVEVSSDGINFFRFPATSNTQTLTQIGPFDYVGDATLINNLAGKYRALYGTPFNLSELQGNIGLDVYNITHVKVIDVVGSIDSLFASYDNNGNAVNDPYPTPFGSGGFDLDAVGVIHQAVVGFSEDEISSSIKVFPNPTTDELFVHLNKTKSVILNLFDMNGKLVKSTNGNYLELTNIDQGVYVLKVLDNEGAIHVKKIFKN